MTYQFDIGFILGGEYGHMVLLGLRMTLLLFVSAWIFGMVLAAVLTVLRAIDLKPLTWLIAAYVEYHRNVPALIQLFVWYFGVAALLPFKVNLIINDYGAEIIFATLALGCNKAAYMSEDFRSGLRAIPVTQMEAARAMGLSFVGAMRFVILPQAWRLALPALMGQTLLLFKMTSLAAAIGVAELTYQARYIEHLTFRIFETFGVVTLIYIVGCSILMWVGEKLSTRYRLRTK